MKELSDSVEEEFHPAKGLATHLFTAVLIVLPKLLRVSLALLFAGMAGINIQKNNAVWCLAAYDLLSLIAVLLIAWFSSLFSPRGKSEEFKAHLAWGRIVAQRPGSFYMPFAELKEMGFNRGKTPREDMEWLLRTRERRRKTNQSSSPSDR